MCDTENSLSHVCPEEAPAALDMLDRHTVRRVTAEQSGRVLHQFFARPIVREAAVRPPAEAGDSDDRTDDGDNGGHDNKDDNGGTDDDETLTQLVARAEEKALVPLEEYELPPVRAICFGCGTCTCRSAATPDHLCVCCCCTLSRLPCSLPSFPSRHLHVRVNNSASTSLLRCSRMRSAPATAPRSLSPRSALSSSPPPLSTPPD